MCGAASGNSTGRRGCVGGDHRRRSAGANLRARGGTRAGNRYHAEVQVLAQIANDRGVVPGRGHISATAHAGIHAVADPAESGGALGITLGIGVGVAAAKLRTHLCGAASGNSTGRRGCVGGNHRRSGTGADFGARQGARCGFRCHAVKKILANVTRYQGVRFIAAACITSAYIRVVACGTDAVVS